MPYYLELPENKNGRDFVVGDLHGCLPLLQAKLDKAKFDTKADRLFCVGDLADRGPDSLGTLALLEQPWFKTVRGNHDDMLLAWLDVEWFSHIDASTLLLSGNGAEWVRRLNAAEMRYLVEVVGPLLSARPYVIHVGGKRPFNVVHAEVYTAHRTDTGFLLDAELANDSVVLETRELLTWGRRLYKQEILKRPPAIESGRFVDMGGRRPKGLSPTYVGHSICPAPIKLSGHYFLDGGAFASYWPEERRPRVGDKTFGTLFMYNHTEEHFV